MLTDLRFALRMLARTPAFTLAAVLTLALGIGANAAIFSVVYAVLLRPLPFPDPDRLIYAHDTSPTVPSASVSWRKYVALRDDNRTLAALGAVAPGAVTLTGRGEPQQVTVARVSGDFFDVFRVAPLAGRAIRREDDSPTAAPVIVLSYGLWQRTFGGNPAIVGQAVRTDGQSRTVIGIMPPDFRYPSRMEAWVPVAVDTVPDGSNFLRLIGRMRDGVSFAQATADLKSVSASYNKTTGLSRDVQTYRLHDFLAQNNRRILLVLQGAVLAVLLVACANVANMLLARSVARRRELSIRAAIGASATRLVRQLFTESIVLAAIGGAAGVLLAGWLVRVFVAIAPAGFAGSQPIVVDGYVLAFAVAVALTTGLIFGVAPARGGLRADANESLREAGTRGATPGTLAAGRALVVAEIGLAIVLGLGAGVMVKSLLRLEEQDGGFRAGGVLTFQVSLPSTRYDDGKTRQAIRQLVESIRAVPGVASAGAISYLPLVNFGFSGPFSIVGRPPLAQADRAPAIEYRMVTPGYFTSMNIPMRRGVDFTDREDDRVRPVVIVNETMARQFWPNENPIGARVQLAYEGPTIVREVIGVVGDVRSRALDAVPVPESFVPHAQVPGGTMAFAIRTDGDPLSLLPAIRQRVAALDPDLPLVRPQTMEAVVTASAGPMRMASTLTSLFAIVAGILACLGVYGLVSYAVAQRTREIGIRVALGANPLAVLRMVVGDGVRLAAYGVVAGAAGTWALTSTLRTLLYEVSPTDPAVLIGTSIAALVLTSVASIVPAFRVLRVDPSAALRVE
jgi:putative ABC transport system permease protein